MALTKEVTKIIKKSLRIRQLIAIEMGVSERTVANWIKTKNEKLVTNPVINVVERETGKTRDEIIVA